MKKEPEKIEVKSEKTWAFTVLLTLIAVSCILLDGYFVGQRAYMSELHINPEIPDEFLVAIAALGFCSGLAAFVIAVIKLFKAKSGKDARVALLAILLILFVGFGSLGAVVLNIESRTNAGTIEAQKRERENNPKPHIDKYDNSPADPQKILELVNQERARIGVAPLVMDENVQKSAQLKADDMEAKGYRQHNIPGTNSMLSPEMAQLYRESNCSVAGENLIWRSDNGIETTGGAFDGWMGSEPHRKAIQNPKYTKTGIAVSPDKRIVVQHFCQV